MNRLEKLKYKLAQERRCILTEVREILPIDDIVVDEFNNGWNACSAEYEKIIAELEGALEFECDCGDNSCRFVKKESHSGMRTNGGCRCFEKTENRLKIMKHMHEVKKALQKLKDFKS